MTFGCPIVSSTSPCLPEICADAALYADPDDVEGWVAAIKRIHDDPELRAQLSARALERAQAFTWRKAAETYLKLMWEIDGRPEIPDLPPLSAGKTSSGLGVAK
jgi:glycosyltransferase involved in cell wall biosynthesis